MTFIDPELTNLNVIADTMAHEIGHTFGLGDCPYPECLTGGSIMGPRTCDGSPFFAACIQSSKQGTHGVYPGLQGPSQCDNSTVRDTGGYGTGSGGGCADHDGDGYGAGAECIADDCDDADKFIHSGCGGDHGGGDCALRCAEVGAYCDNSGNCYTPVLVDVAGDGFRLTGAAAGADFDIDGDGRPNRLGWTEAGSDDSFLALDRDGDGRVTDGRELFGDRTAQPGSADPNGFLALAVYDRPERGGNGDGVIDSRDAVYASLRLWRDADHDGVCGEGELRSLAEAGVAGVSLAYRESRRRDAWGNVFRYRARVYGAGRGGAARWAYDVFLTPVH